MSLARDITTVGGGTLLSRLLAYGRDAGIAALLGTGLFAEAFFAVLQIVNFFRRLLAEGALNGAFVPMWLTLRNGEDGAANADRFTWRSLLVVFCVTGALTLLAILFGRFAIAVIAPGFDEWRRSLADFLLLIAAPYVVLAGLVAVISAALNAEGRVGAAAISTVMFNVVMVSALALAFAERLEPLGASVLFAFAIVVAGFTQFVITGATWVLSGRRWQRPRLHAPDRTGEFFRRALPGLIAAGIPQLKMIAAAAIVSSSPASLSWLYYANRLYELPLGVASIAITAVIVPRIAASLNASEAGAFAAVQSRAYELALGLALPAAAGFAVLAEPIAAGLFEHGAFTERDSAAVAAAVAAICFGLPAHTLEKVFGAVAFAHGDTRTPMITALCGLGAAIVGGLMVEGRYGYVGVAAAVAAGGWVGAGLLGLALFTRGWLRLDTDAARRLPRMVTATAIMAAAVAYGSTAAPAMLPGLAASPLGRLTLMIALVASGLAVYVGALHVLGAAKLKDLAAAFRARP